MMTIDPTGWVDRFHAELEHTVKRYRGTQPRIFRDVDDLTRTDDFRQHIFDVIADVPVFLPIFSPSYMTSNWCPAELAAFSGQRNTDGHLLKVVKVPVEEERQPYSIKSRIGYEFYRRTGKGRWEFSEIDPARGDDHEIEFLQRVETVAKEICEVLEKTPSKRKATVYLSRPSFDLDPQYHALRAELADHRYEVIPHKELPPSQADFDQAVHDLLDQSQLSIHLIGSIDEEQVVTENERTHRMVRPHREYELASKKCENGVIHNLLWIPHDLKADTEGKQQTYIDELLNDDLPKNSEITQVGFEKLKEVLHQKLESLEQLGDEPEVEVPSDVRQIYVIYDQCDAESEHLCRLQGLLFGPDLDVELLVETPVFDDDPGRNPETTCIVVTFQPGHHRSLGVEQGIVVKSSAFRDPQVDAGHEARPAGKCSSTSLHPSRQIRRVL